MTTPNWVFSAAFQKALQQSRIIRARADYDSLPANVRTYCENILADAKKYGIDEVCPYCGEPCAPADLVVFRNARMCQPCADDYFREESEAEGGW